MAVVACLVILAAFSWLFISVARGGDPVIDPDEVYTDQTDIPRPKWADEIILTGSQLLVFRNEKKGLEEVWVFEDGVWRRRD